MYGAEGCKLHKETLYYYVFSKFFELSKVRGGKEVGCERFLYFQTNIRNAVKYGIK